MDTTCTRNSRRSYGAADHSVVALVVESLHRQLEIALGDDPWARGHRAGALAVAAALVDPDDLDDYAGTGRGARRAETVAVLRRHLADRTDARGYSTS